MITPWSTNAVEICHNMGLTSEAEFGHSQIVLHIKPQRNGFFEVTLLYLRPHMNIA